jgi:superfamily II DNA or RNA helicase
MTNLDKASLRIGMTGTLDGTKTHKLVLEGLFGPVRKTVTTKELIDKKQLSDFEIKCLVLKYPEEICRLLKDAKYIDEMKYLVTSDARNKFIRNLVLSLEGNTLILFQYVDNHGKGLHKLIEEKADGRKVFFVHGGTETETREDIRAIVDAHKIIDEITFEFDEIKITCKHDELVPLSNGNVKKSQFITENDDIDASWILNKKNNQLE